MKSALTAAALVFATVTLGCDSERIASLEAENAALAVMLEAANNSTSLEAQERCADQAVRRFQIDGYDKNGLASFTNHYNRTLSKCFIEVH